MKKIVPRFLAAAVCLGFAKCIAVNACAETIIQEPLLPPHGNVCGAIEIKSEVPRDVGIQIKQVTPEGDYVYYDTVIPKLAEGAEPDTYYFDVEGKNDISYVITLNMPKGDDTDEVLTYTRSFTVSDTDYIISENINKYIFEYNIYGDDALAEPIFSANINDFYIDDNNNHHQIYQIGLPMEELIAGDVNDDGKIDIFDAVMVAKYTVGNAELDKKGFKSADYDGNETVNIFDAVAIAKLTVSR